MNLRDCSFSLFLFSFQNPPQVVAQNVYDDHIDPGAQDQFTCYGSACFRMTHMIVALLSLSCVGTSVAMLYTSRHVYNKSSLHRS
jgi:hypothetical protein